MTSTQARILAIVIAVVGILAIVTGVIYYTEAARDLPSFFPGHIPSNSGHHFHRKNRGIAGIVFGAVLLLIALGVAVMGRRARPTTGQDY
jgi:heme A synthase